MKSAINEVEGMYECIGFAMMSKCTIFLEGVERKLDTVTFFYRFPLKLKVSSQNSHGPTPPA